MIGGNNPYKLGNKLEYFDIYQEKWELVEPSLPFDYFNHKMISLENDKIIIIGGFT